ncbi:hypothetical protein MPTK2_7g09110 [Marchantia polymorpha subsp. ruderalis]
MNAFILRRLEWSSWCLDFI